MSLQYLSDLYLSWVEPLPIDTCFEAKCTAILGIAILGLTYLWCSGKRRHTTLRMTVGTERPTYKYTRSGRTYGKYN